LLEDLKQPFEERRRWEDEASVYKEKTFVYENKLQVGL
jgi:hypothetical protein